MTSANYVLIPVICAAAILLVTIIMWANNVTTKKPKVDVEAKYKVMDELRAEFPIGTTFMILGREVIISRIDSEPSICIDYFDRKGRLRHIYFSDEDDFTLLKVLLKK